MMLNRDAAVIRGRVIQSILDAIKPEAAYFTEQNGTRGAVAEPFFLSFNADVEFRIVMGPEDLAKSGLETIGQQWPSVG